MLLYSAFYHQTTLIMLPRVKGKSQLQSVFTKHQNRHVGAPSQKNFDDHLLLCTTMAAFALVIQMSGN